MKKYFLLFILFFFSNLNAQNIFPQKFSGCVTDHFSIESDSLIGKTDIKNFVKVLILGMDEETKKYLSGTISLQIIVDLEGNSCLYSMENMTPFQISALNLKKSIDEKIVWEKPSRKISPLIVLKFKKNSILYKRIGFNAKRGRHIIEEYEIPIVE